ncbi:MAG: hypothetical protein JNL58_19520 [Planctomyces sp.]|nr:hypothetical protein [Planctomyces sp.]
MTSDPFNPFAPPLNSDATIPDQLAVSQQLADTLTTADWIRVYVYTFIVWILYSFSMIVATVMAVLQVFRPDDNPILYSALAWIGSLLCALIGGRVAWTAARTEVDRLRSMQSAQS